MLPNLKIILFILFSLGCQPDKESNEETNKNEKPPISQNEDEIILGAERYDAYLPLLKGKKTAFLVNQTSSIKGRHLIDILLEKEVDIRIIFSPEHGFRGEADAGEKVNDTNDPKTGIPLMSLYGKKKKPAPEDLKGIEYVVFDIQDVGARFYTYISSMSYLMEACAESDIPFLVLDRPNPNGHYVDGPVLDKKYSSFIGLHEIPVVHGMTVGEYARMVNGEGWLKDGIKVDLKVISCKQYDHNTFYELPIKPSPNIPNMRSVYLYPSLCFFEGTSFSAGRGTNMQFQIFGHPDYHAGSFEFTPVSMPGAKYPKHQDKLCKGESFLNVEFSYFQKKSGLDLDPILKAYQNFENKETFFLANNFINTLAGGPDLKRLILEGKSEEEIKATWKTGLEKFSKIRSKYLLYKDFN